MTMMNERVDYLADAFVSATSNLGLEGYSQLHKAKQALVNCQFFNMLFSRKIELSDIDISDVSHVFPESPMLPLLSHYSTLRFSEAMHLNLNEKVTFVYYDSYGFLRVDHTTIKKMEIVAYAQYPYCLEIEHQIKRKRSTTNLLITPVQDIMIYDGWVTVDDTVTHHVEDKGAVIYKTSKYRSFSKRQLSDICDYFFEAPLFQTIGLTR